MYQLLRAQEREPRKYWQFPFQGFRIAAERGMKMADHAEAVAAQKKFVEAIADLTATEQIKWYENQFGDRCADMSISLVKANGEGKTPALRFFSAPPGSGSGCSFRCSDESVKSLGTKIKSGVVLAYLARGGKVKTF